MFCVFSSIAGITDAMTDVSLLVVAKADRVELFASCLTGVDDAQPSLS